jgi:hypothetical protein
MTVQESSGEGSTACTAVLNIQFTEICQLEQNPRFGLQLSDDESLRKEDGKSFRLVQHFVHRGSTHRWDVATSNGRDASSRNDTSNCKDASIRREAINCRDTGNCRDSMGQSLSELTVHFSMHISEEREGGRKCGGQR